MIVIACDESDKKSRTLSRRILSRYLYQIGQDSYSGRLSEEGLRDLVGELRKVARKNTSVSLHRVTGRNQFKHIGVIGHRDRFDKEGFYAYKTSLAKLPVTSKPISKILQSVLRLSALCHDLGKANDLFQAFLQGKEFAFPQRIRHDGLSFLILMALTHKSESNSSRLSLMSDQEFLSCAKNPQVFFSGVLDSSRTLIGVSTLLSPSLRENSVDSLRLKTASLIESELLKDKSLPMKKRGLLLTMLWLVLTHHRLIRAQYQATGKLHWDDAIDSSAYINDSPFYIENLKVSGEAPWENKAWCEQFTNAVVEIEQVIAQNPGDWAKFIENEPGKTLRLWSLFQARPCLITGDQLGSIEQMDVVRRNKRSEGSPEWSSDTFANSIRSTRSPGDSLVTHLKSVSKKSLATYYLSEASVDAYDAIDVELLSQVSPSSRFFSQIESSSRFYWQQRSYDAVRAIENIENRSFFAVLLSTPGSGKTTGGPRILSAASPKALRFTTALGLKSLTLQTGKSYEEDLQLSDQDFVTLIGDGLSAQIFKSQTHQEEKKKEQKSDSGACGSETLHMEVDEGFELTHERENRGFWHQRLQDERCITNGNGLFSRKIQALIDTPVVVCTVDHICRCVEQLSAGDIRTFLRVASSDLILDELDNYSPQDMATLSKLVMLAGFYNRRVILMSGTLNDLQIKAFHNAWLEGIEAHHRIHQTKPEPVLVLVSDKTEPSITLDDSQAPENIERFCKSFAEVLLNQEIRRVKPQMLDLSPVLVLESPSERLLAAQEIVENAVLKTHAVEYVKSSFVDLSGITIDYRQSGCVLKFNKVAHAQEFARYFARERSSGPVVKVVCYHARFPLLHRTLIEQFLNKALTRKKHADMRAPEIDNALERLSAGEKIRLKEHGLCIVVCTTSIEETGKDHDFDFGGAEPGEERNAVQLVGRILRHRQTEPKGKNFFIFSHTLNEILGEGLPYGQSGVQDEPKFAKKEDWLVTQPRKGSELELLLKSIGCDSSAEQRPKPIVSSKDALPIERWGDKLTPAGCLVAPRKLENNILNCLSTIAQSFYLADPYAGETDHKDQYQRLSTKRWLESGYSVGLWKNQHARLTTFRNSNVLNVDIYREGKRENVFFIKGDNEKPVYVKVRSTESNLPGDLLRLSENWRAGWESLRDSLSWAEPLLQEMLKAQVVETKVDSQYAKLEFSDFVGFAYLKS